MKTRISMIITMKILFATITIFNSIMVMLLLHLILLLLLTRILLRLRERTMLMMMMVMLFTRIETTPTIRTILIKIIMRISFTIKVPHKDIGNSRDNNTNNNENNDNDTH